MTRSATRIRHSIAIVLGAAIAACSGESGPPGVPLAQAAASDSLARMEAAHALIGPAAKAALDSGNALFRAKRYAPAMAIYRQAADLAPQHAAPLFGIYMVARATNNMKLADSTLAEISKRSAPVPAEVHRFDDSTVKEAHKSVPVPRRAG